MTSDLRIAASRAADILDNAQLKAAFSSIRERALTEALAVPQWHVFGDRKRRALLMKANMVEELRRELQGALSAAAVSEARTRSGVA